MSDIKLQGELSMDVSKGEAAVDQFGKSANKMAREVEQSASKAGAAVGKIGDGAAASAVQFNRQERSITESVKRATTQLELLGKTASQKLEFKINAQGLDAAKFEPALQKLRDLESQALKAGTAGATALNSMGMSARATSAALRNVPAQFSDIIVSLQGGQAPLTVLLQQGSQLKDMFGGIGNAGRALGGYIMGLVNPFTLAAAAAGTLAVAYYQGGKEAENYNKALILSGNIAGTTTAKMTAMARALGDGKYTQSAAAAAIAELAQSGAVAGDSLQKFAAIAIDVERATGQAISKTAEAFKELEKAPLEATVKLNDSLHYLTLGTYEQIKALTEQGRVTDAARVAMDAYADAMGTRAKQVTENAGALERSWKAVGSAASWAWDKMLGLGRDVTGSDQLAGLKKTLADRQARGPLNDAPGMSAAYEKGNKALVDQIALLERMGAAQQKSAEVNAAQLKTVEAKTSWDKEGEKFLSKQQQLKREILKTEVEGQALLKQGAITQEQYAARLAGVRDKYKETATKAASTTGQSEVAGIRARIVAGEAYIQTLKAEGLAGKELNEGEKLAVKIQKELEGGLKGVALANKQKALTAAQSLAAVLRESDALKESLKAKKEFEALRDREISGQEASILKMEEKALAMEDEVRMYGLGKEAIEALSIARLQERIDILAGFDGSAEQIALIEKEIDARQRLAVATDAKTGLDAGVKAAKEAQAEWTKFYDSIYDGLTDSLYRSFEKGGSFFKNFWDGIKNMFKTTVLKLAIQGVAGGVTGALGLSGAANAASGGGSNLLGLASNASSLYSAGSTLAVGSQVLGGTMGIANGLGTIAANATGTGISGLLATNGAYGTAAAGSGSAMAGGATAALAAIPVWGWVAMAAIAVAGMFGGRGKKEATGSGVEGSFGNDGFAGNSFATWKQDGGWFHNDRTGKETGALDSATSKQFSDSYKAVQMAASGAALALGLSADSITNYSQAVSLQLSADAAANEKAITAMFAGIGDGMARAVAPGIAQLAKEGETAGGTLSRLATSLTTANAWLDRFGGNLLQVSLAGGDAASKLADLFGGLEGLNTASSAFYATYFTEAERAAQSTEDMGKALGTFGLALPDSKEAFRALALSMDQTTDAGRAAYATLLMLAPEFATASDALATLATEAAAAMESLFAKLSSGLQSTIEGIAGERVAVAAAALQINNPGTMSRDAILRGINGTALATPGNAGLSAAQTALSQADAAVAAQAAAVAYAKTQAPSRAALDAAAAAVAAAPAPNRDAYTVAATGFSYVNGEIPTEGWMETSPASFDQAGYDAAVMAASAPAKAAYDAQAVAYSNAAAVNAAQVATEQAKLSAATAAQANAVTAAKNAQLAYIASLQDFAIDASKAVSKLGTLREETLKYYDAQKQLADLMTTSATGLRGAVSAARTGQLDPAQSLAQQQGGFSTAYSMALATSGAAQAGYADKLTAALPGLSTALMDAASTREEWARATGTLFAQSEAIAQQLEANAPQDYAADSLAMLGQIDAALLVLDASSKSAEKIIADAVTAGSENTANGLRAVIAALTGSPIPAFAAGGSHSGGLRIVGERGWEVESTGPSQIFNQQQLGRALSGGGNDEMVQELRALRQEVAGLRAEAQATAGHTSKTARLLDRAMPDGDALATRATA